MFLPEGLCKCALFLTVTAVLERVWVKHMVGGSKLRRVAAIGWKEEGRGNSHTECMTIDRFEHVS